VFLRQTLDLRVIDLAALLEEPPFKALRGKPEFEAFVEKLKPVD